VHAIEPRAGDCLFIPSGRIHAIGAGLLIYEIQQNSDTTYRVFDWNRLGLDGQPRQLHVAESLQSIDFQDEVPELQEAEADGSLVRSAYFDVRLGRAGQAMMGSAGENLTFAVVSGSLVVSEQAWRAGDFAIMPACVGSEGRGITRATESALWLEIRVP
jgi:mannose-6-phosphate isomerase